MLEAMRQLPFWQAFIALYVIVMGRSNATYWVGRGLRAVWTRRQDSAGPGAVRPSGTSPRAEHLLTRYGPFAVAVSYLTIGIQTAIHLTAGAIRMPLMPYLAGAALGSVAWAAIYATIGMAVVEAWVAAQAGSWWTVLGALVVGGIGLVAWRRARRSVEHHLDELDPD